MSDHTASVVELRREPNEALLCMAESFLDLVRTGRIQSAVIVAIEHGNQSYDNAVLGDGCPLRLLGACDVAKERVRLRALRESVYVDEEGDCE